MHNPYEILELVSDCDDQQARRAYLDKIKEFPPEHFPEQQSLISQLSDFSPYLSLIKKIEMFWLTTTNQQCNTWTEHIDINSVMLATSLGPDGYLLLR